MIRPCARRALICAAVLLPVLGHASQAIEGTFTASTTCDAYQSFKNQTNPSSIQTVSGQRYEAREVNSASDYDWIRVVVPGASPNLRWVSKACGAADLKPIVGVGAPGGNAAPQCQTANTFDSYVLAVTWQPGFCEHGHYDGTKPECKAMSDRKLVVANLTLHGLWPNKKGCTGKSLYGNCGGPSLDLTPETIKQIGPWMPNFLFETSFGAHEWNRHGVCQSLEDDAYFLKAVDAVKVFDTSEPGRYIRNNIGSAISRIELIEKIRQSAGADVGKNVTVICSDQKYLQEIRLSLPVDFRTDAGLVGLMKGGFTLPSADGCSGDSMVIEKSGPD